MYNFLGSRSIVLRLSSFLTLIPCYLWPSPSPPFTVRPVLQMHPARTFLFLPVGQTLELTCLDMEGVPFPAFTWRLNGSQLQTGKSTASKKIVAV